MSVIELMRKFKGVSTLRKSALILLVKIVDSNEIRELNKVFQEIDTDHSGLIDASELKNAISNSKVKITEREAQELIDSIDNNLNTKIDYTEFLAGCMKSKIYLKEENLKIAFSYFDKVSRCFRFETGILLTMKCLLEHCS